jgi:hypothetical protein
MGRGQTDAVRRAEGAKREAVPVATFLCPSRRQVKAYPYTHGTSFLNIDRPTEVCRSDYAGNAGDGTAAVPGGKCSAGDEQDFLGNFVDCAGIVFQKSEVTVADIRDGTTHTIFCGERHLNPDKYETSDASDNDQSAYIGHDRDVVRYGSASYAPQQDRPGVSSDFAFGSAHAGIFQAVYCDGSVRGIPYEIDLTTLDRLTHRRDGQVLDTSGL